MHPSSVPASRPHDDAARHVVRPDDIADAIGSNAEPDDGGVGSALRAMVRAAIGAVGRAGSLSAATAGDALEAPGRALAARITAGALANPRPVAQRSDLLDALEERATSPLLGGATGAALAAKVARRIGPLRFLARRTPMWLVVTAAPAVHASITRGADELALVASHLVRRARAAGVEPDADRVRRATVQLLSRAPVDPSVEPRHTRLAVAWLQRALRATLPFSSGVATPDPGALARATASVEPETLGRRPPVPGVDRG